MTLTHSYPSLTKGSLPLLILRSKSTPPYTAVHLKRDSLYQQAAMDYSLELLRQCKALNVFQRSQKKERELPELAILNRLTDEVISLYASEMDVKL